MEQTNSPKTAALFVKAIQICILYFQAHEKPVSSTPALQQKVLGLNPSL